MEYTITILDSFPSLNKLTQKYNILLELNNKDYNLKKLIKHQDSISIKENFNNLLLKVYAILNDKKTLIGINHISTESLNSYNKNSIIWLEFKKKMEENKKSINDLNLLFYDCIRLKIKISSFKTIPKSDKKLKNKSKIKFSSPSNNQRKNTTKEKYIYNNFKDSANINIISSYRGFNPCNNLVKSNSNSLKESIKISSSNLDENNVKYNEINKKVLFHENTNNALKRYNSNEIDPQKSITHEYMKDLMIDNDCLLTDNNIFENYSYSTSLGENNKNSKINVTNIKRIENNNEININNNITDIKSNNNDINSQHSSICPSNFNKMFKNILINSKENNNSNIKIDNSFNKNMEVIKENESFSNNVNSIRKIKAQHKKNKSFNKMIYSNDNNKHSMGKKLKSYNKANMNLKNKSNNIKNIKDNSLSKENLLQGCYTLNDFYNCKILKNSNNENVKAENFNKEMSVKEIKTLNAENNQSLKEIIMSNINEENNQIDKNNEFDFIKDNTNKEERIKNSEFSTLKKDYDLFYSLKFIENIKNDLLNLEFNLALDKSISLFLLYNKEIFFYNERKKELINIIHNYMNKVQQIHKKINLLNNKKRKCDLKEKNKILLNDSIMNISKDILSQKNIFENLIINKQNKKDKLKSIISSLMKSNPSLLETINKNKNNNNENEEKDTKIKLINPSPPKSVKNQLKTPKLETKKNRKNSKYDKTNSKKLIYKKHQSVKNKFIVNNNINKDLQKNNSINNLLSYENLNRNHLNTGYTNYKEKKSCDINGINSIQKNVGNRKNNNLIYYETARTKFYNPNSGKLK